MGGKVEGVDTSDVDQKECFKELYLDVNVF